MKELEKLKQEVAEHSATITIESKAVVVIDKDSLEYATELKKQAKDQIKVIEGALKDHKKRAWDLHKGLCKTEAEQLAPFKSILNILNPKILKYQADQKQIAEIAKRDAEQQIQKSLEQGKIPVVGIAPVIQEEKVKGAGTTGKWVGMVTDLDKLPAAFKKTIVDQEAIDQFAERFQDKMPQPGVRFYEKVRLTGR